MLQNMKPKNIIPLSIKESFKVINNHRAIFILLVVLQIVFIASLAFVQLKYQIKIIENSREILDYFQALNLDESAIAQGLESKKDILGDDPLLIYRKFKLLIRDILFIAIFTAGLILFFNTINWSLTELMFTKLNFKGFLKHLGKLFLLNIFYLLLLGIVVFLIFQKQYLELINKNGFFLFVALLAVALVLYFMFISFSLANEKLRDIFKKTFLLGLKKANYILAVYLINLVILLGLALLLFYVQNKAFILLFFIGVIFFVSFVFCRVFLISGVRRLVVGR